MQTIRLLCTALMLAPCAMPVETRSWVHGTQSDFEKGTLKNLSLRSDGRLMLAPAFRELYDASTAYLWALAVDSKGTLYTGGGGPAATSAKVFSIAPGGQSRVIAELPGLQIQSIAVDSKDRVYAATTPDGKIYRITSGGKFETFYEPKAKYIWAIVFNSKGDLFAATGDGGEIHRVTPDGKGSVFFRTEETHARSLAIDSKDNLVVGTEPGGLLIRVTPAGEGFVVYQSGKREVTSVAVARDGSIYAAAAGNKSPATSGPSLSVPVPVQPIQVTATPGTARDGRRDQPAVAPPPVASTPPPSIAGGSELYRINAEGFPQRVWSHSQDVVYAIGFDAAGRPIVGTGNKGNIYRIDTELISTLLINATPTQVTAFATGPKGRLYAATGNVGKVYQVGPELEKEGSYESEALDGTFFSYWGRVRHRTDMYGGAVFVETRSGNLDRPQKNWSPWAPLEATSGRTSSPSARFLQYRTTLRASTDGRSPELRDIELAYMPKNVAPAIEEIEITQPNYRFSVTSSPSNPPQQTITLPPLGSRRRGPSLTLDPASSSSQTLQFAKGSVGARWAVSDPNGDELEYKIEIRGVGEQEWKLLKDSLKDRFYSWDSTTFPDGEYVVRISASDAPANPREQVLTSVLESERFVIDNSPPEISNLVGGRSGNIVKATWRAKDQRSTIELAEVSLNGRDWTVVQPTTRLSDAPEHEYSVSLEVTGSEQTLAVRVRDEFKNQSVEKLIVR